MPSPELSLGNAARAGDAATVRRRLAAGDNVNARDAFGMTALHWSCYGGRQSIAELLIAAGADVRARDASQETPLHYAATRATTDLADLLLAHGADADARDAAGQTPLHYAAIWNGRQETTRRLIAAGADVNAKDNEGFTPLARAEERLFDDLVALLRRHGGR
jgi:ankyrin repeat protein